MFMGRARHGQSTLFTPPCNVGAPHKVAGSGMRRRRLERPPQRSKCNASPELRFSATMGAEPEIEVALV